MADQNTSKIPCPSDSFYHYCDGNEEYDRCCSSVTVYTNVDTSQHWEHELEGRLGHRSLARSESPSTGETSPSSTSKQTRESKKSRKTKYDTWSQNEQQLLVQLWMENIECLENREHQVSRTAWRNICDELNARMDSNRTVEKCKKKIKYLIDRYKEAKERNGKQGWGLMRKSLFYDEIDTILGRSRCKDIVTLSQVSNVATALYSSPLNTSNINSAGSFGAHSNLEIKETTEELGTAKDRRRDRKKPPRKIFRPEFEEEYRLHKNNKQSEDDVTANDIRNNTTEKSSRTLNLVDFEDEQEPDAQNNLKNNKQSEDEVNPKDLRNKGKTSPSKRNRADFEDGYESDELDDQFKSQELPQNNKPSEEEVKTKDLGNKGKTALRKRNRADFDDDDASDELDDEYNNKKQSDDGVKPKDLRRDRKKPSRKRNRADVEDEEAEERKEFRESLVSFKKCGENFSNFMATFLQTQQQQMAMMSEFIGALTQFMNNANDNRAGPSSPK